MIGKKTARKSNNAEVDSLEQVRELPKVVSQQLAGLGENIWAQMIGLEESSSEHKASGDLKEGEELNLSKKKKEDAPINPDIAPGIDHRSEILHGSERVRRSEVQQLGREYEQIREELKRIAASSKILQEKVKHFLLEETPTEVGKYHVNFVEWLLLTLKQARQQIEDSGAWLAALRSKKKSRQYGSMAKKHGTNFTLSNERVVATQTG